VRLDRSSTSVLSDTELVALAVKLGTKMKDFK
jgi:DNA repair protein RadC